MPELPEVETIRRYLSEILPGQRVVDVVHLDPRMIKEGPLDADAMRRQLPDRVVRAVSRRGKFLFVDWDDSTHLLLHLGMSGRILVGPEEGRRVPHTHFVIKFSQHCLWLVDPRRFGRIGWVPAGAPLRGDLGPEPLGRMFTTAYLARRMAGRQTPVKALLLDQRVVAGLGNIYADEALFAARVHPLRPAGSLAPMEVRRLVRTIRAVLAKGIMFRGTSFSDFVDALGHRGENQHHLTIYGRTGEPCVRCRAPVAQVVVQGRTSHYCANCQAYSEGGTDIAKV